LDPSDARPPDGSTTTPKAAPEAEPPAAVASELLRRAPSTGGIRLLAYVLIIIATGLYLLERLEPVLRPLLIAVLLCYLFLPLYSRLRRHMRPIFSFLLIAIGITVGLQGLARTVYRDVVIIDRNLPRYMQREAELEAHLRELSRSFIPRPWQPASLDDTNETRDTLTSELSQRIVRGAATAFLSVFLELIVVAFYMIFLLQSASRLPDRIRSSFSKERARGILEITDSINRAISEYLVVKVKASLLVGVPVGLACWAFGIDGAVTWGLMTFFGNFLPYIGAIISILPPLTLAFLEYHSLGPPIAFALILLVIHGTTSNLIEPAMTGKALGISPLIVLLGLAFWSLLWGFVGMVLAVPLTVIFKIVLEHTPATRPVACMMSEAE
jgi:predicted PurR-regulated permease PerM